MPTDRLNTLHLHHTRLISLSSAVRIVILACAPFNGHLQCVYTSPVQVSLITGHIIVQLVQPIVRVVVCLSVCPSGR